MESPKSRAYKERKPGHKRRKHKNKAFYNSPAWKRTREAYLREYQLKLHKEIPQGYWTISSGKLTVEPHQQSYILSMDKPCEMCIKLYLSDAYNTIEEGQELDHIKPVNVENALISEGHGDPFEFSNLQYLCKRHHFKKSQTERS